MKKIIGFFFPPSHWRVPVIVLMGFLVGMVAFLLHISRAPSYLSDNPETCINCHIMVPQYATWAHSSHREVANCSDCHVPHDNVFNHYYFKAMDGLRHATIFTLRTEPHSIQIHSAGKRSVQQNCIRCHEDLIAGGTLGNLDKQLVINREDRTCWDCHRAVPHGEVRSLTSTPNAIAPLPQSAVPRWLRKKNKKKK